MNESSPANRRLISALLALIPVLIGMWIWFSPLSFVPVPWPDDSAFYFVGREFWKWPPRWVMLPQAPFEPTYRIFNFNTMPLYPMMIGLGRLIGIDGSFAIKFWPLSAFALTASLLSVWVYRAGLPWIGALLVGLAFSLDPGLRWAAVLVRPESLIGLIGMALVLGLCLGFPKKLQPRGLWDPVSFLLAVAAYAHFNAIHLLLPVLIAYASEPKRIITIGLKTALYLSPWAVLVLWHFSLFRHQMETQFERLSFRTDWLDTPAKAIKGLFQDMGSPEPWPEIIQWTGVALWVLLLAALLAGILYPVLFRKGTDRSKAIPQILPASAWVLSSIWLFKSKPEVWFVYYVHAAAWCFAGVAGVLLFSHLTPVRKTMLATLSVLVLFMTSVFAYVDVAQAHRLGKGRSWHWSTYHSYIDCIDQQLTSLEQRLGSPKPFRVWAPTFPDITVELSRRHPDWDLTRTNDFWNRADLAVQHGRDVEAVVVAETLNWAERDISAPASEYPFVRSVWMTWNQHFLNRLWTESGWKPNRYICQRGRWQAFIFEK